MLVYRHLRGAPTHFKSLENVFDNFSIMLPCWHFLILPASAGCDLSQDPYRWLCDRTLSHHSMSLVQQAYASLLYWASGCFPPIVVLPNLKPSLQGQPGKNVFALLGCILSLPHRCWFSKRVSWSKKWKLNFVHFSLANYYSSWLCFLFLLEKIFCCLWISLIKLCCWIFLFQSCFMFFWRICVYVCVSFGSCCCLLLFMFWF